MTQEEFILQDRISAIQEVNKKYDLEHNSYLSFSGGKDSVILHNLIDLALPNNQIPRVYLNTGMEYKVMVDYVKELASKDKRIIIKNNTKSIKKTLEEFGYPFKSKEFAVKINLFQRKGLTHGLQVFLNFDGPLSCPKILRYLFTDQSALPFTVSDKCCKILKEKPLDDFALENNKSIAIVGLVGGEGGRRDYFVKKCLSKLKNSIKFYPLKVVDKNWEDWFIDRYNIKLCKLYYAPYNLKRTGCRGCPFDKFLQKDLDMLAKYFPLERNQCELIWKPVYDEYRRIGYRLKDKK